MNRTKYLKIISFFTIIFFIFAATSNLDAKIKKVKKTTAKQKDTLVQKKEIQKKRIYLAKSILSYGIDTNFCSEYKIEAALNLATLVTKEYELISQEEIDSIAVKYNNQYSAFKIAEELNASSILVIKLEQLRNLLRAEISRIDLNKPDSVIVGEGYAMLHYFTDDENKAIYDPTVLAAIQRAFATAFNDSTLFSKQNILPAPLLVICGTELKKGSNADDWDIFHDELIKSYEITETIFETISKSNKWITVDIDTRDYLYSLFKLYGVENNIAPTINELDALYRFGIKHYITGTIKEVNNKLEISLLLNEIKERTNIVQKKKITKITTEKNTKNILEIIKKMSVELIEETTKK